MIIHLKLFIYLKLFIGCQLFGKLALQFIEWLGQLVLSQMQQMLSYAADAPNGYMTISEIFCLETVNIRLATDIPMLEICCTYKTYYLLTNNNIIITYIISSHQKRNGTRSQMFSNALLHISNAVPVLGPA